MQNAELFELAVGDGAIDVPKVESEKWNETRVEFWNYYVNRICREQ